ncbi:hypothetical protein AZI84_23925 [Salmonella enterica subsp. enterica serovar Typhi]|nr:hypothetical protein AZI84_23925 [Salmonella enterica subsp. enterica serovar Typhi]
MIRVEVTQILRWIVLFHMFDIKTNTLFSQHNADLMAIDVSRTRKQRQYRTLVGRESQEND